MSDMNSLRDQYMERLFEAAGENLSPEMRKKHAVIVRTKPDGTKEYKFPIPDKKHARLAMSMLDRSDLTPAEKKKVRAAAQKMLGHKTESMKEGGWDKPWTKEDESKMKDDEKKKMMESWSSMSDDEKKKMMEEYGSYGPKMKKKMMEGWGMKYKKKGM